jgi:hypothetical protein
MQTSELLHVAVRARDPLKLGQWYAELFEGKFFLHPVMSALGIVIVKLNHAEAVFDGLVEFWPWDIVWDGDFAVFRRIEPKPSPTSYGHIALKVGMDAKKIAEELHQRGIPHRMEPRAAGFMIPVIDDPEGNMIELFPNIDTMEVPERAFCTTGQVAAAMAQMKVMVEQKVGELRIGDAAPLLLFEDGK